MKLVEYSSSIPEEQIALDEFLLTEAEAGRVGETLRFWEPKEYFVVVGRAGAVNQNCFLDGCNRDGIKIIRRISGGGTVLQGPGCLNYSAVLSYHRDKDYRNINYSYEHILEDISKIFRTKGYDVDFFPISDLALKGKKVSGNAQARKKEYFLHHGTFLLNFDLGKVSAYLKHPPTEPDYRQGRLHEDFLANIPLAAGEIKEIIKNTFRCSNDIWKPEESELKDVEDLVLAKYGNDSWNYAF